MQLMVVWCFGMPEALFICSLEISNIHVQIARKSTDAEELFELSFEDHADIFNQGRMFLNSLAVEVRLFFLDYDFRFSSTSNLTCLHCLLHNIHSICRDDPLHPLDFLHVTS